MSDKIFNDTKLKTTTTELEGRIDSFVACLVDRTGMSKIKPCALQFYLLRHIRNIFDIFDKYQELIEQDENSDDKVLKIESLNDEMATKNSYSVITVGSSA